MNIRVVGNNPNNISNDEITSNFKIKTSVVKANNPVKITKNFKVGDKVKHKEEDIIGEIKFIGQEKIAVVWNDNTRERLTLSEANDELDYVDSIQTEIAPLTPQMSEKDIKNNDDSEMNEFFNNALANLGEDEDDSIESEIKVDGEKIDIEKIKMQQKINSLENKLSTKKSNNIKEKASRDLIDVMVIKGMIDEDDSEIEMQKIIAMDDKQFEEYKQSVLSYENSEHQVTSYVENNDDLSEAERALQKIKGNGGRGIIGDFSGETNNIPKVSTASISSSEGKRSLNDIKDDKFTFNNQYKIQDFEDAVADILSDKLNNQRQVTTASNINNESLPGFENLQGLTKPLVVTSKSPAKFPVNSEIADLFSDLNWTTISRKY